MNKNTLNEIRNYSIADLKLIIDEQQDLYTAEEMKLIKRDTFLLLIGSQLQALMVSKEK